MPNTTVFLLDIIYSNSLHGPARELHQDNVVSNQINLYYLVYLPVIFIACCNTQSVEFV
jgi:hypothetical protein